MAATQAPAEVPSKWDIIPIHTSDVAAFLRCRRYWDWSSPTRTNLRRKVRIYGLNPNLWFGTGIHFALEHYYNPTLQRDPVESWLSWFTLQWEGGTVSQHYLDTTYDSNPVHIGSAENVGELYRVEGLRNLLPEPSEEEFMGYRELGSHMMEFYKEYAAKNDDFEVIAAEAVYSIPLELEAKDWREDSPNYGKVLEVHARGKRDGIVYRPDIDRFGLVDHKTAAVIGEDYFLKLENDRQCGNYMWASQKEAELYDKPWKKVDYVLYQALRKNYPKPPTLTSRGLPSLNRNEEGTTAELFAECIKDNNLGVWFDSNEKAQNYYTYLLEAGDKLFIQRDFVRRNQYELKHIGEEIRMIAEDMLDSPKIYPRPTGGYDCTRCQFRVPCIARDDGSDWQGILADAFENNPGR